MILLNIRHLILTFVAKHRFFETILQLTYTYPKSSQQIRLRKMRNKPTEDEALTLAILHLFIGLRLYIGGRLNQVPNYFLTKSTK